MGYIARNGWILFSSIYWIFHNPWNYIIIMIVVMIALGLAVSISLIVAIGLIVKSYFGNMLATFSIIIVTAILLLIANKWLGQPTEQELKSDREHRRSISQ